jgi:hypothetical protein
MTLDLYANFFLKTNPKKKDFNPRFTLTVEDWKHRSGKNKREVPNS